MEFYVSTTAFRRQKIEDILSLAEKEGLNLEFSSGLPYRKDMIEVFKNASCPRLPHNYFPAPESAFVLNLASDNSENRDRSLHHARQGLELASSVGAPLYSAHAGFCLDPAPEELGHKLKPHQLIPRPKAWENFISGVKDLCQLAKDLNILLLIENNVISQRNLSEDGSNPVLCANAEEFLQLAQEIDHPNFGLLIDTAHLKVSANTLGFSAKDFVEKVSPWVKGLHHSDNDGLEDTNLAIDENYWFLEFMPAFKNAVHVLEVHDQSVEEINRQRKLLEQATIASNT